MTVNEDGRPELGQIYEHIDTGRAYTVVSVDPLVLERTFGPIIANSRRPQPQTLARAYRRVL